MSIGNWDGQITAKALFDMLKKVSDLAKNGDDFSKLSFKVWDNSEKKQQNPNFPDYSISFKIGDGQTGAWVSGISLWQSKPKSDMAGDLPFVSNNVDTKKVDDEDDKSVNIEDLPF